MILRLRGLKIYPENQDHQMSLIHKNGIADEIRFLHDTSLVKIFPFRDLGESSQ